MFFFLTINVKFEIIGKIVPRICLLPNWRTRISSRCPGRIFPEEEMIKISRGGSIYLVEIKPHPLLLTVHESVKPREMTLCHERKETINQIYNFALYTQSSIAIVARYCWSILQVDEMIFSWNESLLSFVSTHRHIYLYMELENAFLPQSWRGNDFESNFMLLFPKGNISSMDCGLFTHNKNVLFDRSEFYYLERRNSPTDIVFWYFIYIFYI